MSLLFLGEGEGLIHDLSPRIRNKSFIAVTNKQHIKEMQPVGTKTTQRQHRCHPFTYLFYILGQLFSDLASNNSELLASLVSVLKKLPTHQGTVCLSHG
jgi:hypothetical protein